MTDHTGISSEQVRRRIAADPLRLIQAAALLYLEIEAGRRPARHLRRIVSPSVYQRLQARTRSRRRRRRPAPTADAITAIHTSHPAPGAVEASVVATVAGRARAIALRLERHVGQWRLVELACPEDRVAPRRTASLETRTPRPDAFDEALAGVAEDATEPLSA
ncbi:MAG: Rv3235 family protein [Nitriliruptorales bacterium]|nr:Rv3235 family protein [Nitriliruptorales bacterium]